MQFTAGTEVKCCLVGGGSLQVQGEFRLLPPGDAVPAGDLSSVGIVDIQGVVDQPEPVPWVLSIPEHSIMTLSLRTFQRNAHSCLCDPIPWGLGHTRIHGACEETRRNRTETGNDTLATVSRDSRKDKQDTDNLRQGFLMFPKLTCSQETKGHTAEEHGAHGRERQGAGVPGSGHWWKQSVEVGNWKDWGRMGLPLPAQQVCSHNTFPRASRPVRGPHWPPSSSLPGPSGEQRPSRVPCPPS